MVKLEDLNEKNFEDVIKNPEQYVVTSDDYTVYIRDIDSKEIFLANGVVAEDMGYNLLSMLNINYDYFNEDILSKIEF